MMKLTKQLKKTYVAIERLKRIKRYIPKLTAQISGKEKQLALLSRKAHKEYNDIEQMKKLGLRKLFTALLGDFEARLEKERQDYLLAVIEVQSKESELQALVYQKEVLLAEVKKLPRLEKELKVLLKRMEISKTAKEADDGRKIIAINLQILKIHAYIGEIKEADTAGEKAKKYLVKLHKTIGQFIYWGDLNQRYHGKGRNSSYVKKMEVDRSKGILFKCKGALDRFEYELEDVSKDLTIEFTDHMEIIHDFLDIFLDNLITDWIVSQKLRSAFNAIDMVVDKVSRLQQMLGHQQEKRELLIESQEKEKLRLLLK